MAILLYDVHSTNSKFLLRRKLVTGTRVLSSFNPLSNPRSAVIYSISLILSPNPLVSQVSFF